MLIIRLLENYMVIYGKDTYYLPQNALLMAPEYDLQGLFGILLRYVADWEIMSTFAAEISKESYD